MALFVCWMDLFANLYSREYLFVFMFAASAREQETLQKAGRQVGGSTSRPSFPVK